MCKTNLIKKPGRHFIIPGITILIQSGLSTRLHSIMKKPREHIDSA